ncbi:hypothetical protein C0995_008024 [Termitomyces sp. Mi166|nr:hypothetical protein C0995_008024 [Termitomyces sp. Mi166\
MCQSGRNCSVLRTQISERQQYRELLRIEQHVAFSFVPEDMLTHESLKSVIRLLPPGEGVNGGGLLERDDMSNYRSGEEDTETGNNTSNENTVYLSYDLRDEEKSIDSPKSSASKLASSTFSKRESNVFDTFDPNLDADSLLGRPSFPVISTTALTPFTEDDSPYPELVAQLLVFPAGRLSARLLPNKTIFGLEINPGPFSIKEHVLVTVMATVGAQSAYATDIVAVQRVFYHQTFPWIYQWLLVMSTQLIGFSIGGVARRFLVAPPSMSELNIFNYLSELLKTLHPMLALGNTRASVESGISYTPLWLRRLGKVNQIFGYHSGLGFSLLTFDWNQIAFIGSPLATPWWAEANVMIGFFFFYWFLTPIFYVRASPPLIPQISMSFHLQYTNVWYSQYMPISSINAWDNAGKKYNVSRIIDDNASINYKAYRDYSPVYLSVVLSLHLWRVKVVPVMVHTMLTRLNSRNFYVRVGIRLFFFAMLHLCVDKNADIREAQCDDDTYGYITMAQVGLPAMQFTADFKLGQ